MTLRDLLMKTLVFLETRIEKKHPLQGKIINHEIRHLVAATSLSRMNNNCTINNEHKPPGLIEFLRRSEIGAILGRVY